MRETEGRERQKRERERGEKEREKEREEREEGEKNDLRELESIRGETDRIERERGCRLQ